jgi:hypothetical protein
VTEDPTYGVHWHLLGTSRYRNGDFAGAVEALSQGQKVGLSEHLLLRNRLFLAMAQSQMGNEQLANEVFVEAGRVLHPAAKHYSSDTDTPGDFGIAIFNELWREAEQLLNITVPAIAPKPKQNQE